MDRALDITRGIATHGAYAAAAALLICAVPRGAIDNLGAAAAGPLLAIGLLGLWRYSWAALNFARAVWFRAVAYPAWRTRRDRAFAAQATPCHCYFMVTTFMVDVDTTTMVYRRLFAAAAAARDGATIVTSVVHGADARLIRQIFETMPGDMSGVRLVIDRIKSSGKRDAMAKALRILARLQPARRDIVVFVDGDTVVPLDVWARAAPVFTDPKVGALTTDEAAIVDRRNLFADWFDLRFDQRQVMMCSMGLAHHVLTLTGRMSVFRADLATHPEFIGGVSHDSLEHPWMGHVAFLTGDDKSTWFWLLRNGYRTEYLPDIRSASVETQPRPGFLDSAQTLMTRWFGNMMRNNGRAIRLGPRGMGLFTWWSIVDQRLSMWTTLVGPTSVIVAALGGVPQAIPLYVAWVMLTRWIFCACIAAFRGTWFPVTHPFVLYFGQIAGALVKSFVFFRLDRQKWTRQAAGAARALTPDARAKRWEQAAHHALALGWVAVAVMLVNTVE